MALGAAYDVFFATTILAFPDAGSRLLGIPLPEDRVYFHLTAVFLLILAAVWYLPARFPGRFRELILIASAGRALGAASLFAVWWAGAPTAFVLLAGGDLIFSSVHGWTYYLASRDEPGGRA